MMKSTKENCALVYELWIALKRDDATNFTAQLFRLIQKADPCNLLKLSLAYPLHVRAFREWQFSKSETEFFAWFRIDAATGSNLKQPLEVE